MLLVFGHSSIHFRKRLSSLESVLAGTSATAHFSLIIEMDIVKEVAVVIVTDVSGSQVELH